MTMRDHGTFDCERFADRLMAHLEGDDDAATRIRMETHAAACDRCAALLAEVRRISFDAAHLPTLAPSRDLWPEIAARIEAPVIALGATDEGARATARRAPRWLRPVAAAAALVIATAGITYVAMRDHRPERAQVAVRPVPSRAPDSAGTRAVGPATAPPAEEQVASAPSSASRAPDAGSGSAVVTPVSDRKLSADATYDLEIRRLRAIVRQRRAQMDTSTLDVIERNLAIIDGAIAQCRAALARDPNSRFLLENLNGALDTKVQLLRTAAMLPART